MEIDAHGTRLVTLTGDLTRQDVDVVVNAANIHLQHGGGVAAAIASGGGPVVQEESDAWVREHGPLEDGVAAVTSAGDLPARYVVHVAGPVYDTDRADNADRLALAVRAALDAARDLGARSVALPAISAGIYGYPLRDATMVMVHAIVTWLSEGEEARFDEVRLVGFDQQAAEAFATAVRAATG